MRKMSQRQPLTDRHLHSRSWNRARTPELRSAYADSTDHRNYVASSTSYFSPATSCSPFMDLALTSDRVSDKWAHELLQSLGLVKDRLRGLRLSLQLRPHHIELLLKSVLSKNPALQKLELDKMNLRAEDLRALAELIHSRELPRLQSLSLKGVGSSQGLYDILSCLSAPSCALLELDLSFVRLNPLQVSYLSRCLKETAHLTALRLNCCGLQSDGLRQIFESLQENRELYLRSLELEKNSLCENFSTPFARYLEFVQKRRRELTDIEQRLPSPLRSPSSQGYHHFAQKIERLSLAGNQIYAALQLALRQPERVSLDFVELNCSNTNLVKSMGYGASGLKFNLFKNFCIVLSHNQRLQTLKLANVGLSPSQAPYIASLLRGCKGLATLDISHNSLQNQGISLISAAIPYSNLRVLDASFNYIEDTGFAAAISCMNPQRAQGGSIMGYRCSRLRQLHFAGNMVALQSDLGYFEHYLRQIPDGEALQLLDLSACKKIKPDGLRELLSLLIKIPGNHFVFKLAGVKAVLPCADSLVHFCEYTSALKELHLQDNGFSDAECAGFLAAFYRNPEMRKIDLSGSVVGEKSRGVLNAQHQPVPGKEVAIGDCKIKQGVALDWLNSLPIDKSGTLALRGLKILKATVKKTVTSLFTASGDNTQLLGDRLWKRMGALVAEQNGSFSFEVNNSTMSSLDFSNFVYTFCEVRHARISSTSLNIVPFQPVIPESSSLQQVQAVAPPLPPRQPGDSHLLLQSESEQQQSPPALTENRSIAVSERQNILHTPVAPLLTFSPPEDSISRVTPPPPLRPLALPVNISPVQVAQPVSAGKLLRQELMAVQIPREELWPYGVVQRSPGLNSEQKSQLQELRTFLRTRDQEERGLLIQGRDDPQKQEIYSLQALRMLVVKHGLINEQALDELTSLTKIEKPKRVLLSNIAAGETWLKQIVFELKMRKSLRCVVIEKTEVEDGALPLLTFLLKEHFYLKAFAFRESQVSSQGVGELLEALEGPTALLYLGLENCGLESAVSIKIGASLILLNPLRVLNLSGNNLQDIGCLTLVNNLSKQSTLQQLILQNNQLTSFGAGKILDSLGEVESDLRFLDLQLNPVFADSMAQAMVRYSKLKTKPSLVLSTSLNAIQADLATFQEIGAVLAAAGAYVRIVEEGAEDALAPYYLTAQYPVAELRAGAANRLQENSSYLSIWEQEWAMAGGPSFGEFVKQKLIQSYLAANKHFVATLESLGGSLEIDESNISCSSEVKVLNMPVQSEFEATLLEGGPSRIKNTSLFAPQCFPKPPSSFGEGSEGDDEEEFTSAIGSYQ